jgi:eukaryotic-like serine/threonine-protein kinase
MKVENSVLPPNIVSSPTAVYAAQGAIYALEASNGTLRQTYDVQGVASPTVAKDVLYLNVNNLSNNTVQALRVNDGIPLWSYKVEGRPSGSPTVIDGVVYTSTAEGYVYALQASDGSLLWHYETGPFLFGSPTVVNEVVYVSPAANRPSKPSVYALRTRDGSLLWRSQTLDSTAFSLTVTDEVVYISAHNGWFALRISDGSAIWWQEVRDQIHSSPIILDGKVFISLSKLSEDSSSSGSKQTIQQKKAFICALQASDGSFLWQHQVGIDMDAGSPTSLIVAHGVVYIGADNGHLYALRVNDGTPLWHYKTNGNLLSSPTMANGVVCVGANDGYVYALQAENGSLIWQAFVSSSVTAASSISIQLKKGE